MTSQVMNQHGLLPNLLRNRVSSGELALTFPSGRSVRLSGKSGGRMAAMTVREWRALPRMVARGSVGFAEGYVNGEWDTPSLPDLLYFFAENLQPLGRLVNGFAPLRWIDRALHARNRNSINGSQKNIAFHYDLGNRFYEQWLDSSMSYSSGIFEPGDDLQTAQRRKLERLCRTAKVEGGHNVLEIGCGWGGLLEHLGERGIAAEGVSVSAEQVAFARERVRDYAGVDAAYRDYREVSGSYDRILSVEMFEAVGQEYWDTFAERVARLLKPDGMAGLQVISIDEQAFDAYRARPDFIQQYVFPGGMLPTVTHLRELFARHGLRVADLYRFGQDYATTLRMWRERFAANWQSICEEGFDERFFRMWNYYLAYCEAAFRVGRTDVVQLRLERI